MMFSSVALRWLLPRDLLHHVHHEDSMSRSLPQQTRVVVVGGGIIGCIDAYHLAKQGCRDVLLIEQGRLGAGSTSLAAGLVGGAPQACFRKFIDTSAKLYAALEQETGVATEWQQIGSLVLAQTDARMIQFRRLVPMAQWSGLDVQLITAEEVKQKWPLLETKDLLGAMWLPAEGRVNGKQATLALARGAQERGATIAEGVRVMGILRKNGRAVGVATTQGDVAAEQVVICAGMWSRGLGLDCGATIPVHPVEHPYLVSKTLPGFGGDLACVRDPDAAIYFRTELGGRIVLGTFPKQSRPCAVDPIPADYCAHMPAGDWDYVADAIKACQHRLPALESGSFEKIVNAPVAFTPDTNFILGETPEVAQLFVGAGFNGHSLAYAGGAGEALAQWVLSGEQPGDMWSVDVRRFGAYQNNREFLRDRVTETPGLQYRLAWPNYELETSRNTRRSPLHDRLLAQGAVFGSKMAIERPIWFARGGTKPANEYSFGRQNWWNCIAEEHRATRENVALFDETSFSKYLLKGRDAVRLLDRLSPNYADVPIGKLTYSGMLNARGGFESDLCFVRLAEDQFYLVSGSAQPTRDVNWVNRHIPADFDASITDVSHAYSVMGVMGPNSRKLLNELTDADLSLEAFPFSTAQWINIARVNVLALRITYVGELGWELHVRMDQVQSVYEAIQSVAKKFDLTNAGYYSINSLRMEKAYRGWGSDITAGDTPYEAGLGFMVKLEKPTDFIGKEALRKQQESGVKRRLASFIVEDPAAMLWGGERIFRDGKLIGSTTSGYYGFTLGRALALGYVRHDEAVTPDFITSGNYTIDFAGKQYPAKATLKPPYDPKNERIMC
jgi:4-methylaminobutanoate oxidase (formaldehyde-forming)